MASQDLSANETLGRSRNTNVLKAAGAMGAATFLSRFMGLVREQVFAYLFGAGNATDAFNVAFRIPNLLRDLFAEGAMSASLVPTFTLARVEKGDAKGWRLAGLVFRVLFVFVGLLTILGIVFAPQLVGLYAAAYHQIPGKFELTVRLTRTMFPYFPVVAVAAAFMGILNACGIFFIPAFSSALFNLASVLVGASLALVLFHIGPRYGIQPIEGMAMGVLFGGAIQALSQLPSLRRAGYRWQPRHPDEPPWYRDPFLRRMLWMMVPGTVGLAATQVNILVNTILATSQGPGAVSWLNYAFRLMQFPIGVFGVSLAVATLPRISEQWVRRELSDLTSTLSRTLRQVFAINLPASAGLIFLGAPIIQMIFQYGRFYGEDTSATAMALAMYSIGLTAYSSVKVLVPACYALGNTRVPVISSVFAVTLTIILNLIMIKPFGYWGLALGTSIAATMNSLLLFYAVRRLLAEAGGKFEILPLFGAFLRNLLLALAMGLVCRFTHSGMDSWLPDSIFALSFGRAGLLLARLTKVGLVILEGIAFVILVAKLFRFKDTTEAFDLFYGKLKKKLRPQAT